jgi:hypothetical protein
MTLEVSIGALQLLREGWSLQLWAALDHGDGYYAHFSRKHYPNPTSQRSKIQAATSQADTPGEAIAKAADRVVKLYP